ncbi:hypothetical protein SU10_0114 [Escherichia phage vB_EcoP_SU10]|uniref:Uncharacterized protein n=1 Tax=Escherichia phage vB_EcoP_SU10 TaxID=1519788 RepID=A0A0B4N0G4_9CAUD|nr:hypothetical protein ACQ52_gp114 [Escherichia phage vB_EcoP_SU10]AIF71865.1 hypothetical protein SU10_0114 [Escherichia phage vB_EcoP_SU10]
MIIDMNNSPKVLTLGDLESGDVFQFPLDGENYYMLSSQKFGTTDKRSYINLSCGVIATDESNTVIKKISNARLTNKVD